MNVLRTAASGYATLPLLPCRSSHVLLLRGHQRASGGMVATAEERQTQIDKNKALKKQLQTTHYEIGTDDDYM